MSSPISSFSKLSITQRMQSSRGHARGHSEGKGKGKAPAEDDPSSSDESPPEESGEDDDEDVDASTTEHPWSKHIFALDHCRQHGTRYAFQIADAEVKRCSIRITTTDPRSPTCSCEEGGICRHILWLLGQLAGTSAEAVEAEVGPYERISTLG